MGIDAALARISELEIAFAQPQAAAAPAPAPATPFATVLQAAQAPAAEGVTIPPDANRPGVPLAPELLDFVRTTAALAGTPVTIGTGTNHNRLTVDGNVSDHWDGHAADIPVPVDSEQGDRIAAAALQTAGVPPDQALAMARRGGLYTLEHDGRRIQVIWRTDEGGNHHNHVHIGVR